MCQGPVWGNFLEPDLLQSLIRIDPSAGQSLVQQLYHGLRAAILEGRFLAGDTLPSTRKAAEHLALGRNTIVTAYELLAAEGFVTTAQGKRPVVVDIHRQDLSRQSIGLKLSARAVDALPIPERKGIMAPGSPDQKLFPADLWGRALRKAARHRQDGAEGYAHFSGLPELRSVLSEHLHRHRGLSVPPEDILVTSGTQASLMVCAHAFADSGEIALIEDPGYRSARASFMAAGLQVRPLGVDAQGALADEKAFSGAKITYVTPSTQYPSGVRMTLSRRQALLDVAKASNTLMIEDDYDSEFVWRGRGIASLGALSGGQGVITIGSAAKSLLPGLRIGWIAAPKRTGADLAKVQRKLGMAANVHAQAALAELMSSGNYRAHINKITSAYRQRMERLRHAIGQALGDMVETSEPDGGLQLVMRLPDRVDDAQLCKALNKAGFAVGRLQDYAFAPAAKALVIGFGNMSDRDADHFAMTLKQLVGTYVH